MELCIWQLPMVIMVCYSLPLYRNFYLSSTETLIPSCRLDPSPLQGFLESSPKSSSLGSHQLTKQGWKHCSTLGCSEWTSGGGKGACRSWRRWEIPISNRYSRISVPSTSRKLRDDILVSTSYFFDSILESGGSILCHSLWDSFTKRLANCHISTADPTITNHRGHDAIYEAELNDKVEVVKWVLAEGGKGMEEGLGETEETPDEDEESAAEQDEELPNSVKNINLSSWRSLRTTKIPLHTRKTKLYVL